MPFLLPPVPVCSSLIRVTGEEDTLLVKYALIALGHGVPFVVKLCPIYYYPVETQKTSCSPVRSTSQKETGRLRESEGP